MLRPTSGHGSRPPCSTCPKVPPGHPNPSPAAALDLDDRSRRIIDFHDECRAVNTFPDDPAVRFMARVIMTTREECAAVREDARFARLSAVVAAATVARQVAKR